MTILVWVSWSLNNVLMLSMKLETVANICLKISSWALNMSAATAGSLYWYCVMFLKLATLIISWIAYSRGLRERSTSSYASISGTSVNFTLEPLLV